ncbi:hypothetical protein HMSSN036_71760 [Paenibacillus macerans]|nr:hypothetical protein HMSSN036_71760 [Paenibacillus macerans]
MLMEESTSKETGERVMFQFAYRQLELIPIRPQGQVQDVAVFIGEHFSNRFCSGSWRKPLVPHKLVRK